MDYQPTYMTPALAAEKMATAWRFGTAPRASDVTSLAEYAQAELIVHTVRERRVEERRTLTGLLGPEVVPSSQPLNAIRAPQPGWETVEHLYSRPGTEDVRKCNCLNGTMRCTSWCNGTGYVDQQTSSVQTTSVHVPTHSHRHSHHGHQHTSTHSARDYQYTSTVRGTARTPCGACGGTGSMAHHECGGTGYVTRVDFAVISRTYATTTFIAERMPEEVVSSTQMRVLHSMTVPLSRDHPQPVLDAAGRAADDRALMQSMEVRITPAWVVEARGQKVTLFRLQNGSWRVTGRRGLGRFL